MSIQTNNLIENVFNRKVRILNTRSIETKEYIKCKGQIMEEIEGKKRVAFIRCPKCKNYISLYKNEVHKNGRTIIKRCIMCGLYRSLKLLNW